MFSLIDAQLSYSTTTLWGYTRVFRENSDLLVFGGVWALTEIPGPNRQKKIDPPKIEKKIENVFCCSFKNVCSSKTEQLFFVFGPWGPLKEPCTEKTEPFSGQTKFGSEKTSKNMLIFFCCGFKKCVCVENGAIVALCFVFGPWCSLLGVRTEKT